MSTVLMIWLLVGAAPLTLAGALEAAEGVVRESPQVAALVERGKSQAVGARERLHESPLSLNLSLAGRWSQPEPGAALPSRSLSLGPSAGLSYRGRSGLSMTLDASYEYMPVTTVGASTQVGSAGAWATHPFSSALRVGFDVLQGGRQGTAWTRSRAAAETSRAALSSTADERLQLALSMTETVAALFELECTAVALTSMEREVTASVATAKLQLETKTLSQKDYLNFAALETNFATRLAQTMSARAEARLRLEAFGAAARGLSERLATEGVQCELEVSKVLASPPLELDDVAIEAVASRLPSALASEAALLSASYGARATQLGNRPHLEPFVAADLRASGSRPLVSATAGLSMQWNVPWVRGRLAEHEASLAYEAARLSVVRTAMENRARIRTLLAQVRAQRAVLVVLQRARENLALLLRTLDAQKAIGLVDSLNTSSATLDALETQLTIISSFVAHEQARYLLTQYLRAAEAGR